MHARTHIRADTHTHTHTRTHTQVPYDARLVDLFWGEELLMALQLWTAGATLNVF
jgi:hypothetical protein